MQKVSDLPCGLGVPPSDPQIGLHVMYVSSEPLRTVSDAQPYLNSMFYTCHFTPAHLTRFCAYTAAIVANKVADIPALSGHLRWVYNIHSNGEDDPPPFPPTYNSSIPGCDDVLQVPTIPAPTPTVSSGHSIILSLAQTQIDMGKCAAEHLIDAPPRAPNNCGCRGRPWFNRSHSNVYFPRGHARANAVSYRRMHLPTVCDQSSDDSYNHRDHIRPHLHAPHSLSPNLPHQPVATMAPQSRPPQDGEVFVPGADFDPNIMMDDLTGFLDGDRGVTGSPLVDVNGLALNGFSETDAVGNNDLGYISDVFTHVMIQAPI